MTAGEIRALAVRAGIGPDTTVLDVCCGIAGPGRFVTRELGCDYLGVDASAGAVAIARAQAAADDLPCRFAVAEVPPVPGGPFDVVLLLETMLEITDKDALAAGIGATLRPGGRFAFTLEAGVPFTAAERAAMPDSDTLSLTPLEQLTESLGGPGSRSRGRRITAAPTARRPRRSPTPTPRTARPSPRRSAARGSTTCSPPTGSGSTGSTPGGCASSR